MNDMLLNRCEELINNFKSIQDGLNTLEDDFITNGEVLEQEQLDMFGNYEYFIDRSYNVMALNGFQLNSFDTREKCDDIIENLDFIRNDLKNGWINTGIDYDFILGYIYTQFSLYGSFIRL